MKLQRIVLLFVALGVALPAMAQHGQVKITEGTLTLPTYTVGAPEKAPNFSRYFAYQRARRGIYPYALDDNTQLKEVEERTYKALYLENDYIEMCVLPEIGGRLFYAIDKTNGYDIFYHQHVIKPANVGMLGAWISGGVEFNVFHHHRASSNLPVDYKLVSNDDGSKTIWVGEVEPRQRMSWAIGMTLHPDKSYIEVTGRMINNTANRNSILYWSNVSTSVNDDYQIIFPESTDFGTYHHKNSFVRWPMSDAPYCGIDQYKNGIDCSWWKNHPQSISIFAYDLKDDFIAGYDHGKKAGTMLVGNHNINKGGKLWQWGPSAYGHAWDCVVLTDNDGPYVELMVSAYSDNQPDYCWLNPYEVKEFTSYWYGIRDLNNVKRGNEKATLNMEVRPGGKIYLAANTTQVRNGAQVVVTGENGTELFRTVADIAPDKPYAQEVKVSTPIADPTAVTFTLLSDQGEELLSYTPRNCDTERPMPEVVTPYKKPDQIDNQEELYFSGMRNVQFHNAHVHAEDYFMEALRRDPGDTRCNTQMGVYYRMRGQYDKAAAFLRKSLERQTANQTRPRDGEAMYNLGLVLKAQGKTDAAIDTLYRAAWDYAYSSPAYYQLAQISVAQQNVALAEQQLDFAVRYNGMNLDAKNLQTTLWRLNNQTSRAEAKAREVLAMDPINFYATYELSLLTGDSKAIDELLRNQPESYLELASYYLANGYPTQAESILLAADKIKAYPTVKYYLGWLADARGDKQAAGNYFKAASSLPTDYCFPYRLETINVYQKALEYMPNNANTCYYMGNLLFEYQPDLAMEYWHKTVQADPQYAMALRNLGWGYRFNNENYDKAIEYYQKAIAADRNGEATFLSELDQIYERQNVAPSQRYEMLTSHHQTAHKRYEAFTREIRMMTIMGDYDQAIAYLIDNYFPRQEHVDDLHDIFVDVCLTAGLSALNNGNADKALEYFLRADTYPENHFYARLEYYARNSQVYYLTGLAYEKAGRKAQARKYYKMAVDNETRNTDFNYEKSLALKKLNSKADVSQVYTTLIEAGQAQVTDYVENFFESFDSGYLPNDINTKAYYTMALGYLGRGDKATADSYFKKAVQCHADNLWALYYLGKLK